MRPDVGEAWERTPPELLAPPEPVPSGRWVRILGAFLGASAGGAAGASLWVATCEELECVGWFIGAGIGAVLGAPYGFAVVLDIQRWWRYGVRRRGQVH